MIFQQRHRLKNLYIDKDNVTCSNNSVVRRWRLVSSVELECVGEIEAEYGNTVEHRQTEQCYTSTCGEHVWVLTPKEPYNGEGHRDKRHQNVF